MTIAGDTQDIPDEKLIEIGKAAVLWHAENGRIDHDPTCPHSAGRRHRIESLGLACDCGAARLEEALLSIWEE